MNTRIVILFLAALLLAFLIQSSAAFAVQSPVVPTPEPTPDFLMPKPTRDVPTPFTPDPLPTPKPLPPKSDLLLPHEDLAPDSYHFEFKLGDLGNWWDDIREAVERWLKERGIIT